MNATMAFNTHSLTVIDLTVALLQAGGLITLHPGALL